MNDFVLTKELSNIIVGNVLGIVIIAGLITAYGLVFHLGIKILEKKMNEYKASKNYAPID